MKISTDEKKAIANDHLQSEEEYENFTRGYLGAIIPVSCGIQRSLHLQRGSDVPESSRRHESGRFLLQPDDHLAQEPARHEPERIISRCMNSSRMAGSVSTRWSGRRHATSSTILDRQNRDSTLRRSPWNPRKIIPNPTKVGDIGMTLPRKRINGGCVRALGRKCIGIELDAAYVEAALKRLEKLTGEKAVKV